MFSFRDEYVCNDIVKHSFIHSFMCVMLSLFQPGNRMFSFRDEYVCNDVVKHSFIHVCNAFFVSTREPHVQF